ncbi:SpoIIE family protein phosphatase, partial [bacterium]|nr:SpoIIE family protein phosphatase [bacterium]
VAGEFVIEGSYQAAAEVGGDFFDVFRLPDGRVGCIIADVAGKGLGGCLVTSMLAVLIRSLRDRFDSPRELLIALEDGLVDQLAPGVFVTAFFGILNPESGVLTYASAAHSPLLVYRAQSGEVERFETRGIPIGAMRGGVLAGTLQDAEIVLASGDLALQYTDGLNEAPHAHTEEEFGFGRIVEVLAEKSGSGRRTLLKTLQERARRWSGNLPQSDDLTLLAISREGAVHRRVADRVNGFTSDEDLLDNLLHALHLKLNADLDQLGEIGRWIGMTPGLKGIPEEERALLETGLYEICANIAEHGYGGDTERSLDIWWQPDADADGEGDPTLLRGHFLIRDRGAPFDPAGWTPPDLSDKVNRLKGRGLGMLVVDKLASDKTYLPGTAVGNLYLVGFRSLLDSDKSEEIHV